jgi:hypothetical protein
MGQQCCALATINCESSELLTPCAASSTICGFSMSICMAAALQQPLLVRAVRGGTQLRSDLLSSKLIFVHSNTGVDDSQLSWCETEKADATPFERARNSDARWPSVRLAQKARPAQTLGWQPRTCPPRKPNWLTCVEQFHLLTFTPFLRASRRAMLQCA